MDLSKDIINIVRCMKSKEEKKRLNKEYHNNFRLYKSFVSGCKYICYKNNNNEDTRVINYRDIRYGMYRETIMRFLTDRKTKYKVPKNY